MFRLLPRQQHAGGYLLTDRFRRKRGFSRVNELLSILVEQASCDFLIRGKSRTGCTNSLTRDPSVAGVRSHWLQVFAISGRPAGTCHEGQVPPHIRGASLQSMGLMRCQIQRRNLRCIVACFCSIPISRLLSFKPNGRIEQLCWGRPTEAQAVKHGGCEKEAGDFEGLGPEARAIGVRALHSACQPAWRGCQQPFSDPWQDASERSRQHQGSLVTPRCSVYRVD